MGLFSPIADDSPEDRGRLPALDAEAVRDMAAVSMVGKGRHRRIAEAAADDSDCQDSSDSDNEEFEERARKKRKGSVTFPPPAWIVFMCSAAQPRRAEALVGRGWVRGSILAISVVHTIVSSVCEYTTLSATRLLAPVPAGTGTVTCSTWFLMLGPAGACLHST